MKIVLLFVSSLVLLGAILPSYSEFGTEFKKLTAIDGLDGSRFGSSLALSESHLAVGAPSGGGSAYVFAKDQGGVNNWGGVKKLVTIENLTGSAGFGYSVDISGNVIIVGAADDNGVVIHSGAAYIFAKDQGGVNNWGEVKKLTPPDGEDNDHFGGSVSISGNLIVIGAHADTVGSMYQSGSAYVFAKDQGGVNNWGFVKKLVGSDKLELDHFGMSVSIFGNNIVIGTGPALFTRGMAYIFAKDQGGVNNWGEVKKITSTDGVASNMFAFPSTISDKFILLSNWNSPDTGSSYLFEKDLGGTNNWGQRKQILASDATSQDAFGRSISIFNNLAIVGSLDDDGGLASGSAYIFAKDHGGVNNWGQVKKIRSSDIKPLDAFGDSTDISSKIIAVGVPGYDDPESNSGAVYLFDGAECIPSSSGNWIIVESCTLLNNVTILGNVIVENSAMLTIPNGVILDMDFANHNLTVKSGSSVLIKTGGKIN